MAKQFGDLNLKSGMILESKGYRSPLVSLFLENLKSIQMSTC